MTTPTTMAHRATVAQLAQYHGWTRGAELGTGHGHLAEYLLVACPDLYLITVDTFTRPAWKAAAETRLARFGARVRIVEAQSVEAAREVPDQSLDFVFIDAGHSYAAVAADIAAWRRTVTRGGWLGGHDYHASCPGVIRAVSEAFDAASVQHHRGWVWGVRV